VRLAALLRSLIRPGEDEDLEHGEPGPGKVLVTLRRDQVGDPIEQAWVDEEIAWQWSDRAWRHGP
jgi:hypothetical protein